MMWKGEANFLYQIMYQLGWSGAERWRAVKEKLELKGNRSKILGSLQ
jgi:hypothetical protein